MTTSLRADDWPQWRGPTRDGVWRETGLLDALPPTGLKVRWRARIGTGYSGPVVAQGRVYVTDHLTRPEVERVLCFDEATGKPLWEHAYSCDYEDMEYGNGPRASPTVHGGKVYTLGTKGHLCCLDAVKGDVLWKRELVKDFAGVVPRYGVSAAPLVVGDLLIVVAGGQPEACVVALDLNSGQERWRAVKDRAAYSAPVVINAGGSQQLIVWSAEKVTSFEAATGKVYWQVPRRISFDDAEVVASPVLFNDRLLCVSAWSKGTLMLKLDAAKPAASILWKTGRDPSTMISTPIYHDDSHFYASTINGSLGCFDAATGDEMWTTQEATSRRGGTVHLTPLPPDSRGTTAFLFNQSGHLVMARLTAKGYQELGRCLLVEPTAGYRPQGPVTWAHPAYANRCVYARNDRDLVCTSLAANSVAKIEPPKQTIQAKELPDFKTKSGISGLAFSPDDKLLALGTWFGETKIVDLNTNTEQLGPARHKDSVCTVAFSPDGKLLASAGGNEFKPARNGGKTSGEVKLWGLTTRTERNLIGHTDKVFAARFSPDGQTLATASADRTIRLWDVSTGKERRVLAGHTEAIWSLSFSRDGALLASASSDRSVKLWDIAAGKERGSLVGHTEEVMAVAISPDGKTAATGGADWSVRLWDLEKCEQRALLKGHNGTVYYVAFTGDGQTLATGSGDETIKLWNVANAQEITTLRGHKSGITALAFTRDDQTLATAGRDDAVRLWSLPKQR